MDGLALVKALEGFTPKATWDYKQNSNGYGTRAQYPGETIDQAEADRRLNTEYSGARDSVLKRYPNLAPHQADALGSFTYNLGPGWMNTPTRLRAALDAGDHETASKIMQEYNKAGGQVLPGLVTRRSKEAALFLGGPSSQPPASPVATSATPSSGAAPMASPYSGPSPDDVAFQRRLAAQLMGQGSDASPVGHWTQALARVLQGGVGAMNQSAASQGEKQGTASIVDMLQGQQQPTASQLVSNPWTRDVGMKVVAQSAKGPEYGKQGTIVQDGQGNFYAVQFNDKGETKYHRLETPGGGAPTGVMNETGAALQPSKGIKQIGSTIYDAATGKPKANVEESIAGKEKAEEIGKVQGKFNATFPKLEAALTGWERQADNTDKVISRAIDYVKKGGQWVSGYGGTLANLPSSSARKLRNDLDTIKANIGFDKLQAMREASPTGGALGAVSDMENRLLQAVQGALDQMDDPKSLEANLATVQGLLRDLKKERRQAFQADVERFGGAGRPQGAGGGPGIPSPPPKRLKFNPATGELE